MISRIWGIGVALFAMVVFGGQSWAAPALSLSRAAGPPTTALTATVSGFPAARTVDVYFDTQHTCVVITSSLGRGSCKLRIPNDAQPDTHWVSSVLRYTGTGAQKPFVVRTDWPEFHGTNALQNGNNPYENTINIGNVHDLALSWSAQPTPASFTYGSAIVAEGRVFVRDESNGFLYAFDARSGAKASGFPRPTGITPYYQYDSPAYGAGNVFVAGYAGTSYVLHGFNAKTGAIAGHFPKVLKGANAGAPTTSGNGVYIMTKSPYPSQDRWIEGFNALTGDRLPNFPIHLPLTGSTVSADSFVGAPAVFNGKIYVTSAEGRIYVYSLSTGTMVFYTQTAGAVLGTPAVYNGVVHYGTFDGWVFGIDAATGHTLYSHQNVSGRSYPAPVAIASGMVFATTWNAYVTKIAATYTWSFQWERAITSTVGATGIAPIVANGVLYAADQDSLMAFDTVTGLPGWRLKNSPGGYSSPAIADGRLYVTSRIVGQGLVRAFTLNGTRAVARGADGLSGKPPLSSLRPNPRLKAQ